MKFNEFPIAKTAAAVATNSATRNHPKNQKADTLRTSWAQQRQPMTSNKLRNTQRTQAPEGRYASHLLAQQRQPTPTMAAPPCMAQNMKVATNAHVDSLFEQSSNGSARKHSQ